jgi:hypothetical protein
MNTYIYNDLKRYVQLVDKLYNLDISPSQTKKILDKYTTLIENELKFKEKKENILNNQMQTTSYGCNEKDILQQTTTLIPNIMKNHSLNGIDYGHILTELKVKLKVQIISNTLQKNIEQLITQYIDLEINKEFESSDDETELVIKTSKKIISNKSGVLKWWNDICLDKIKITDVLNTQTYIVAIENGKLLNRNHQCVGYQRKWIDADDEIPEMYKTKDNVILHPNYHVELYEYIIQDKEFTNLPKTIYREFVFDADTNTFRNMNEIEHIV